MAHIDLDEEESQALHLHERLHIWANEGMVKICGGKPKYDYFKCKTVKAFRILVLEDHTNELRLATEKELEYLAIKIRDGEWPEDEDDNGDPVEDWVPEPQWADQKATELYWNAKGTYLVNKPIRMPQNFITFANKQCWAWIKPDPMALRRQMDEAFVTGQQTFFKSEPEKRKIFAGRDFAYGGSNTLVFSQEGTWLIPFKGLWFIFKSGVGDKEEIDMPFDIFTCIPLYCAALALQIDHTQKAQLKMSEFMVALANITTTDFTSLNEVMPTFE